MSSVIIIAEAGVNHNGDLSQALELIDFAAQAGADFVKFQTFRADKLVTKNAKKAEYQIKNAIGDSEMQYEMLKKLEIGLDWYPVLIKRCKEMGIKFLSTAFDEESIDILKNFNIPFFKIPSGEITNKPYLQYIARKGKDIILSTGMAYLNEVENAIQVIEAEGISRDRIIVLHCNTEYPTPMEDVNLLAMNQMARDLGVKVGYSDHTLGIEVPIAAAALGACVVEKHFTLDRSLPGPDHAASLEPLELKAMVVAIRNIERAVGGSGIKEPSESEKRNIVVARKSIHLKNGILKGNTIKHEDLIMLRPGDGISPVEIDNIIGRSIIRDLKASSKLSYEDLL